MTLLTYVWGQSGPTCWSSHEQVLLFPQNMTKHVISCSCYTVIICPSCQVVEGMMVEWQVRMLPSHWPQLESMFRHFWVLTHWIFLTSDHSVPTFVNGSGTFPALFVAKKTGILNCTVFLTLPKWFLCINRKLNIKKHKVLTYLWLGRNVLCQH